METEELAMAISLVQVLAQFVVEEQSRARAELGTAQIELGGGGIRQTRAQRWRQPKKQSMGDKIWRARAWTTQQGGRPELWPCLRAL